MLLSLALHASQQNTLHMCGNSPIGEHRESPYLGHTIIWSFLCLQGSSCYWPTHQYTSAPGPIHTTVTVTTYTLVGILLLFAGSFYSWASRAKKEHSVSSHVLSSIIGRSSQQLICKRKTSSLSSHTIPAAQRSLHLPLSVYSWDPIHSGVCKK